MTRSKHEHTSSSGENFNKQNARDRSQTYEHNMASTRDEKPRVPDTQVQTTYREWKEAQNNKNVSCDEKPSRDRPYNKDFYVDRHYYDPNSDMKFYDGNKKSERQHFPIYDPRCRPRHYGDNSEYADQMYTSPSFKKSPSASQSPLYYGDTRKRTRTSSNNSDISSFSHPKKFYADIHHSSRENDNS